MKRYQSRETYAQLSARIEEFLRPEGITVVELSQALAVGRGAISRRLSELMLAGRAHYIEMVTCGGMGHAHVWLPGPAPDARLDELQRIQRERAALAGRRSIADPVQVTHQIYLPTGRRDPLVAALFGPAARAPV